MTERLHVRAADDEMEAAGLPKGSIGPVGLPEGMRASYADAQPAGRCRPLGRGRERGRLPLRGRKAWARTSRWTSGPTCASTQAGDPLPEMRPAALGWLSRHRGLAGVPAGRQVFARHGRHVSGRGRHGAALPHGLLRRGHQRARLRPSWSSTTTTTASSGPSRVAPAHVVRHPAARGWATRRCRTAAERIVAAMRANWRRTWPSTTARSVAGVKFADADLDGLARCRSSWANAAWSGACWK